MEIVTAALAGAGLGGSAYTLLAASAVRRFVRLPAGRAAASPPVTVLKPLHGAEAELYGNLRSFCAQLYPRFQIIFGVRDETDPAIAVVRRLVAELPDVDIALVVDSRVEGNNFKVSNLENMVALAKHNIMVIADSDMHVKPDYLIDATAPLAESGDGLVTCLYRGRPVAGICSRLGAMFINHGFLPSALIGERLRPGDACFGATMALRRDIYIAIGGVSRSRCQPGGE